MAALLQSRSIRELGERVDALAGWIEAPDVEEGVYEAIFTLLGEVILATTRDASVDLQLTGIVDLAALRQRLRESSHRFKSDPNDLRAVANELLRQNGTLAGRNDPSGCRDDSMEKVQPRCDLDGRRFCNAPEVWKRRSPARPPLKTKAAESIADPRPFLYPCGLGHDIDVDGERFGTEHAAGSPRLLVGVGPRQFAVRTPARASARPRGRCALR